MNRKAIAKWSVFGLLLAAGVGYVWENAGELRHLLDVRAGFLPVLLLPPLALLAIMGLLNKVILDSLDVRLVPKEWFGLAVVTNFGNHLLPVRGGASAKALYLKIRHQLPISIFVSTLGATYLLNTLLAASIGAVCVMLLDVPARPELQQEIVGVLVGAALVLAIFMLIPVRLPEVNNWALAFVRNMLTGWEHIRSRPWLLSKIAALLLANFLALAINLRLCFFALGIEVSLVSTAAIATLLGLTRLIALTPANLGIQEAGIAFVAELAGVGFDEGLAVGLLLRLMHVAVIFVLGPIYSYRLTRDL